MDNLLDFLDVPKVNSNMDFFGDNKVEFGHKITQEDNISGEVLNEFNSLNRKKDISIKNNDNFNFFSDAEEIEY